MHGLTLLHRRRFPVQHYVLVDLARSATPEALLAAARRHAEVVSLRLTGHADRFTLIHNGGGIARRALPHVHIVCTGSRWQKGLMYVLLGLKNLAVPCFDRDAGPR
jgi:hypothetical protein